MPVSLATRGEDHGAGSRSPLKWTMYVAKSQPPSARAGSTASCTSPPKRRANHALNVMDKAKGSGSLICGCPKATLVLGQPNERTDARNCSGCTCVKAPAHRPVMVEPGQSMAGSQPWVRCDDDGGRHWRPGQALLDVAARGHARGPASRSRRDRPRQPACTLASHEAVRLRGPGGRTGGPVRARRASGRNQPQAALIEGEAGIGKSSLLAKLGASLGEAKVLRASGAEDESHLAYGLVAQIVAAGRGVGGRPSKLLASGLNDGVDPLSAGPELLGLLDTIGRGGELVVLLVDDLHWADTASARALLFALRRLRADPVLVVVTSRPGELARHGEGWYRFASGDERATSLALGPFGTGDLAALSRALGSGELSPAGATSLLQHTGGNPLYCATLLRELGAGALGRREERPRVPKSLASIILVRMARMTADARALVTAAAVLGQRCPLALAVQLASTADPLGALDQAVSASLLVEEGAGTEVAFAHPLVWSAVYGDLSAARRRELHARAASLTSGERALAHRVAAAAGPDDALAADLELVRNKHVPEPPPNWPRPCTARPPACPAPRPRGNASSSWPSIR